MEDWMISLLIAGAGVIATFAVLKQKVADSLAKDDEQDIRFKEFRIKVEDDLSYLQKFKNESKPQLEHLSRVEQAITKKLDNSAQEITRLNQQITQSPTMKEVREEFVTKEMYKQLEKHIDEKFTKMESHQERTNDMLHEVLSALRKD